MKRALLVAAVATLALGFVGLAFSILVPGQTGSQTQTASKTSTSSSTSASWSGGYALLMAIDPPSRLIPLGGNANFTLTLYNLGNLSGNFSISLVAPSALSLVVNPTAVAMSGSGASTDLRVLSSGSVSPGTYPVSVQVRSSIYGVFNQTFDFNVVQYLVQISGSSSNAKVNLTVKVGSTVIWIRFGALSDDRGPDTVTFLNINVSSGPLQQFTPWSYTFDKPGVYRYYDRGNPFITGEIVVTS